MMLGGHEVGLNLRLQRMLGLVIAAALIALLLSSILISDDHRPFGYDIGVSRHKNSNPPEQALPAEDGSKRPKFLPWETTSSFQPISFPDIGAVTDDDLCRSFPQQKLANLVQPVLKFGHGDQPARVESQLASVSACLQDLLIFSDYEETIAGRQVHDVLATTPASYRDNNPDFINYLALHNLNENGTAFQPGDPRPEINGWIIDKYKFLPIVEQAWALRPNKRWYFFYESDTYVVWDNVFRMLENLDADTPMYLGSPSPGRHTDKDEVTFFANGGPGYALSRGAMKKLLARKVGKDGDYVEAPLSHRWLELLRHECCGDSVIGWALFNAGVTLSGLWPTFSPNAPHNIPFGTRHWCQPMMTMHKMKPEYMVDFWKWEHVSRNRDRPLLYRDAWEHEHAEQGPASREIALDWDNRGWGEYSTAMFKDYNECAKFCAEDTRCFQWLWHLDTCRLGEAAIVGVPRSPEVEKEAPTLPEGQAWSAEQSRFVSGWNMDRIGRFGQEHNCDVVEWLRPSNQRMF
ncbi:glycosyltransferase family 31 [Apiospora kogelbergensis]|uniref:N-acetylgalactosaminide beta-1,3-galactosyltransferase n=1 Tax=Apiospora kogelbergensis TaxID=1337665 RepID=A0AAW0QVP4_9PEZI